MGKKLLWVLVIGFVVFAIFTAPEKSGNFAADTFGILAHGVQSIFTFFGAILDRIPT